MTAVGTYWRTLRHLKLRQLAGRAAFRLGAPVPKDQATPPRREPVGEWVLPARRKRSLVAAGRFRFLNRERALDEGGWDPPQEEKLWRYNLHYFDDLNADGAEFRRDWHAALISHWIQANPPAKGTGWEPYPTSLRVVNWIKWLQVGSFSDQSWIASLALQVRWLSRRLEWHLLGNHLFVNAKALVVAGLYFRGTEADTWRKKGVAILSRELHEQVLCDGGHFERSPMYHLLALEDVLDLIACIQFFGAPDCATGALDGQLRECAGRMLMWADVMRFNNGSLPRFNDAAEGVAPAHVELARVAGALGITAHRSPDISFELLAQSGYARMDWDGARAILDVAPIGPDYLPGHAHADTLSFELEIACEMLIVNRGTSCYGLSDRRTYERGTSAHSTVQVLGLDSSETWGGFRVGRRARPFGLDVGSNGVSCSHDGYRYLPGSPVHQRKWTMVPRGLYVEDSVSKNVPAVARYHLAAGLRAEEVSAGRWRIRSQASEMAQVVVERGKVRLTSGIQAIGFGVLAAAETLEVDLDSGQSLTRWQW